jgi:uncharacterized damage-inducible protein DinB
MDKETLLEQFTECYDKNGWFVAVRNALEGVTAAQAVWKPDNSDNSILGCLSHLNYYNFAYLQRFKGINYKYTKSDNDETFESAEEASKTDWKTEIERFDAIMVEWRGLLAAADGSKFDEPVSDSNPSSWASLIARINAHNAYHGGQILLLRKLQGSWNPARGVN